MKKSLAIFKLNARMRVRNENTKCAEYDTDAKTGLACVSHILQNCFDKFETPIYFTERVQQIQNPASQRRANDESAMRLNRRVKNARTIPQERERRGGGAASNE